MLIPELKTRLGIPLEDTSQDELLALILADAQAFFKDYCNRLDVPVEAESVIGRLAVVLYSRNADQYKQAAQWGPILPLISVMMISPRASRASCASTGW